MIVKELIEKLQAYPSDMLVACGWYLDWEENDIQVVKDFPVGDPANPKCEFLDEVLRVGW